MTDQKLSAPPFTDAQKKVQELLQFLRCTSSLNYMCFSDKMELVYEDNILNYNFEPSFRLMHMNQIASYVFEQHKHLPIMMLSTFHLVWLCGFEFQEDHLIAIHVFGPVFFDSVSFQTVKKILQHRQLSTERNYPFTNILQKLPVIYDLHFMEYATMLEYALSGNRIESYDVKYMTAESSVPANHFESMPLDPDAGIRANNSWLIEESLMRMVETGNIYYKKEIQKLNTMSHIGQLTDSGIFQQRFYEVIVQITLVSRAAIRGGLSPEVSLTLSDQYFKEIDKCTEIEQLNDLSQCILNDYITRVHDLQTASALSLEIKHTKDYIDLYCHEKINLRSLAQRIGYSDSYLSVKFKKEMNMSITDYVTHARIEKAKLLLEDPSTDICHISDDLGFASQSYFGKQFKHIVGCTPTEYRRSHSKTRS